MKKSAQIMRSGVMRRGEGICGGCDDGAAVMPCLKSEGRGMEMERLLNREKEPDVLGDETGGGSPSLEGGVMNKDEKGDSGRLLDFDFSLLIARGGGRARPALLEVLTDRSDDGASTNVISIHPTFSSLTTTNSSFSDAEGDVVADEA
jgi:hypothetical protein